MKELFRQALAAQKADKLKEAASLYKKILRDDKGHRPSWVNLGAIFAKNKDHDGAITCYRKALALGEDDMVHFNLGTELYRKNEADAALTHLLRAVALNPAFFRALLLIGFIYEGQKQHAKAATAFQKALALEQTNRIAALGLAMALSETDRSEDALQICSSFLKGRPDDAAFQNLHAALLMKLGRYRESFDELKQITATNPKYVSFEDHLKKARHDHESEAAAFFADVSVQLKDRTVKLKERITERREKKKQSLEKEDMKDLVDLSLLHLFSGDRDKALAFLLEAKKVADKEPSQS